MTVVVAAVAAAVVDASSAVALNTGARCIAVRISFRALAAAAVVVVATASFGKTANQFAFERTVVVAAAAHRYFRIGFDTYRVVTFVA